MAEALRLHESTLKGRKIRVTTCGKRNKDPSKPKGYKVMKGARRRLSKLGKKVGSPIEKSGPGGEAKQAPWEGRRATAIGGEEGGKLHAIRLKKRGSAKKKGGRGGGAGKGRKGKK